MPDPLHPAPAPAPKVPQIVSGVVKLLITGGAGFIGSNFVRWILANTDDQVTVYDALTYAGNRSTLCDVETSQPSRFRFVRGDVCDPETFQATLEGHDAVLHFAAESHVDRSIAGPKDFVVTNCVGTNAVMQACRVAGTPRVVHVSTDEVYGSIELGRSVESDPLDPRSPYSASKAASDLIARSYYSTYDLPVIITRSSNNFGPWQYPEKVIPLFVTNLLDGRKLPLYGDGLNTRDWIYVEDNCAAIDAVLRSGTPGEIYNVGGDNELSNRDLTDRLLALAGANEDMVEYVADRLGHDRRYAVEASKVRSLGWAPRWELDDAMAATFAWYRDNRWWWEPLKPSTAISS
jgi:dTDP-glucose 4,6-dehydratase